MGTIIISLALVMVALIIWIISKLDKVENRMRDMKFTLDQIADQVDVPDHLKSDTLLNEELIELLREGNDLKAVKEVRNAHGLSLIEAKRYVDTLKEKSV